MLSNLHGSDPAKHAYQNVSTLTSSINNVCTNSEADDDEVTTFSSINEDIKIQAKQNFITTIAELLLILCFSFCVIVDNVHFQKAIKYFLEPKSVLMFLQLIQGFSITLELKSLYKLSLFYFDRTMKVPLHYVHEFMKLLLPINEDYSTYLYHHVCPIYLCRFEGRIAQRLNACPNILKFPKM